MQIQHFLTPNVEEREGAPGRGVGSGFGTRSRGWIVEAAFESLQRSWMAQSNHVENGC